MRPQKLNTDIYTSQNEVSGDENLKYFNKPWKDYSVLLDDYDEHRRPSEPRRSSSLATNI